jgi:hypothetical protein
MYECFIVHSTAADGPIQTDSRISNTFLERPLDAIVKRDSLHQREIGGQHRETESSLPRKRLRVIGLRLVLHSE